MTGRELFEKFVELNGDTGRRIENPRDPWQRIPLTEQFAWEDLAAWIEKGAA